MLNNKKKKMLYDLNDSNQRKTKSAELIENARMNICFIY